MDIKASKGREMINSYVALYNQKLETVIIAIGTSKNMYLLIIQSGICRYAISVVVNTKLTVTKVLKI